MFRQSSFGHLALIYAGKHLPLEVLHSAAGHYIGTRDIEGPVSRESAEYPEPAELIEKPPLGLFAMLDSQATAPSPHPSTPSSLHPSTHPRLPRL